MIDLAILFTCITVYEYQFDTTKSTSTRDVLYIFLTIFTVLGFVLNWFGNKLYYDFEVEVKGALANQGGSTTQKTLNAIGKICKL